MNSDTFIFCMLVLFLLCFLLSVSFVWAAEKGIGTTIINGFLELTTNSENAKSLTIEEYRKNVPELLNWFHDLDSRRTG